MQRLNYNLLEFQAVPESSSAKDMRSKDYWGLPDPKMLREVVMLSWLGKTRWSQWPVYQVPVSRVTLGLAHGHVSPGHVLATCNSALVDMCHVSDRDKCVPVSRPELYSVTAKNIVKPSLGVGFVRNIDLDQNILYLATCVPPDKLVEVNCLIVGQLQLPASILTDRNKINQPYVNRETNNPLDATWQRYHKPRGC